MVLGGTFKASSDAVTLKKDLSMTLDMLLEAPRVVRSEVSQKPRPIIIIDTNIIGGPGRGILQLMKYMESVPISYVLCTFSRSALKYGELYEEGLRRGAKQALLRQRFCFDPTPIWQLINLIRNEGYNLIQSHGYKGHLIALFASRFTSIPWIAFNHGWTAENLKVKFYHSLDKYVLRFADIVVAVSPQLFKLCQSIRGPGRRTEKLTNAVDSAELPRRLGRKGIRSAHKISDDTLLIGCFGRLSPEKGQELLINAFAKALKTKPNMRLITLGDGVSKESLIKLCSYLGISSSVSFEPYTANIRDYYEAIDLLVLPSRSEGLPNVVLEAMSLGVPVLATDVGGLSTIIQNGLNGFLIKPNSSEDLSQAILYALKDPERLRQVGLKGKHSIDKGLSPDKRSQKIVEWYRELCCA